MQDLFTAGSRAVRCLPQSLTGKGAKAGKACILPGLLGAVTLLLPPAFADSVTNPVSAFPITIDGKFTGGVSGGTLLGEWSDITPLAFIAPPVPGGPVIPTFRGDPNANSLIYAGTAPEPGGSPVNSLYLMYDFLPRNPGPFLPGETIASIKFPINVPASLGGGRKTADVQFRGLGGSFFDVFVDINLDNVNDAAALGLEGSVGFGPSTLSANPHLLAELEVPLDIPPGFADPNGPLDPNGQSGVYSPDPAFWGSGFGGGDQGPNKDLFPGSAANVHINPDGSVTISSVPEPSAFALFAGGTFAALTFARRKRHKR